MFQSGVPEKIVAEVTGHKSMKALRQYERTTEQQFQAVGNSISCMEAFEPEQVLPQSEVREEKLQDSKPDKAALVGELQKALPSISGNLNNILLLLRVHTLY